MTFIEGFALGILITLFVIIAMDWIPGGNKQSNDETMSIISLKSEIAKMQREYKEMSEKERASKKGIEHLIAIKSLRNELILKQKQLRNAK